MARSRLNHRLRTLVVALAFLAIAILSGGQTTDAYAGLVTRWSNCTPAGTVGANLPVIVQASTARSADPLVPSSLKLFVDGTMIPRPSYTAAVHPTSVYVYYSPSSALSDGLHTFRVEVSDSAGRLSARQWTATVVQPPSAAWVSPQAGVEIADGRPVVALSLSDNTPGTTFTVLGQVRSGSSSGPVVAEFGGSGTSALQSFPVTVELAPGTYYLTATIRDGAGNSFQLQGTAARRIVTAVAPAMTVLDSCDPCHAGVQIAHPTRVDADCVACHAGYDGVHMSAGSTCGSCHYDGPGSDGSHATVRIQGPCTQCHTSARPEIPSHTALSVDQQHQGSCGGCHAGSLLTRHAVTPAGSAYAYQCGVCHNSTDAAVADAIATGDTSCEACHGQQHGDITAAHTYSGMSASCAGSGCHVATLPEAHAAFVGPGKRYPQYADTCDLCHENDDPERVDIPNSTADCASCHSEMHGDVAVKHASPTTTACFGSGCHDVSRDLPTVHAPYVGAGTEYGYSTTCELCHANRDPERIDWETATAQCTGSCHSGSAHASYSTSHAVPSSSVGCTVCHGTDLSGAHGALADTAKCATCHSIATNWTKNAACASCHDVGAAHGDDQAVHQPSSEYGAVMLFSNHDGMGYFDAWVDCTMCHGAMNLLDVHDDRCETCHLAPRNSFSTWNRTCQQGGCHVTVHASADAGHSYFEDRGDCEACHDQDWGVPIQNCGGCHALADTKAPTTYSNARASYVGPATVALNPTDPFPSSGIARTVYQLDGGAVSQGTSVVVPAPTSGSQAHTLAFRSEDASGFAETTKTVNFTVFADLEAPHTTSNAKPAYVGLARIQLTATDNATINGVKATYYRLNGGPPTAGTLVTIPQPASTTEHTLEFWSVDTSDNEEEHHTVVFSQSVDTLPPVTTTTGLNAWHTFYRLFVTLNAVDVGDSGVAASYARVDNGPIMGGPSTGTLVLPSSAYTVSDGMHTFTYWSVDAVGNIESQITTTFGVDQSAPVVSTDAVATYTGPATIRATAVDSISGVDASTWTYRVNGGAVQVGDTATIAAPVSGSKYNTVVFYVKNGAGLTGMRSAGFTVYAGAPDTTPPTGTMSLNSGATATNSTAATVNSVVSDAGTGVTHMSVDPGTGTFGSWLAYNPAMAITLPSGSGTKTVRVQYRDAAGNILTLSDTIVLDTVPPAGTMVLNGGSAKTASVAVTVDSVVSDNLTGVSQMRIDPGTGSYGPWTAYGASVPATLPDGLGTKTVTVQYRDGAGNILELTDTIEMSTADMTPPATTASTLESYSGTATVILVGTDDIGGSGVANTYYRLDGGAVIASSTVVVSPPQAGSEDHTLEFWSVDYFGNVEEPHQTVSFSVAAVGAQSQTFAFTGSEQTFVVPSGVTELTADLWGGQGGGIETWSGGLGGYVRAVIPVTPGETLTLKVGGEAGMSSSVGAWPNGGSGGGTCGSSGGGSTSILSAGAVLAEAGAGGGADHEGFDGGAGGAQGTLPGGNESGGAGSGAGGGGGWNGGAGYAEHEGGGGGGTSYIAVGTGIMTPGVREGDGAATLSWEPVDLVAPVSFSDVKPSYSGSAIVKLGANDSGGSGVATTWFSVDGAPAQQGQTVTVTSAGSHTLEFWSVDAAGNIESPGQSVTFTVTAIPVQTGTIRFGWDYVPSGSWAEVWVRDARGNIVYHESAPNWSPEGWFIATVPVDTEPYALQASWYDAYTDDEDISYGTALINTPGKIVTWMY